MTLNDGSHARGSRYGGGRLRGPLLGMGGLLGGGHARGSIARIEYGAWHGPQHRRHL